MLTIRRSFLYALLFISERLVSLVLWSHRLVLRLDTYVWTGLSEVLDPYVLLGLISRKTGVTFKLINAYETATAAEDAALEHLARTAAIHTDPEGRN